MKKSTPFPMPAGSMPVRIVPTQSARDPSFYEDESGVEARGEPIEPMELDQERGMPSPRATSSGLPFKLDGGRR